MSEYQYYEWQTVDRTLSPRERAEVDGLSSHIEVGPSKAVVIYNWSDFRHDPKDVLLKYFDGFFYFANWGSKRLIFRFPRGLLDEAEIRPYCVNRIVSFETVGDYQVLDLDYYPEFEGGWYEEEPDLSHFIQLRADLLEGDYRLLYLAWLRTMSLSDEFKENFEPPVPPGLKKLNSALQNFVQIFDIDLFLVQAAAEASAAPRKNPEVNYHELIGRLPRSECDDFLTQLAEGDPGVRLALRKRLSNYLPKETQIHEKPRVFKLLLEQAALLQKKEKVRQAEINRQKHIAEMEALAARETEIWQEVHILLDTGQRTASVYDQATGLLDKLKQLSEFQDTGDIFLTNVRQLEQEYANRPGLIKRWKGYGWV